MIRKYHNYRPQTNPWHREEQPQNTNRRKTVKASNHALSSSIRWLQNKKEHSVMHKKQAPNTEPPQSNGGKLNNESTTTEPPP